ncbi:MAG: malonyl-CoA decarboxylase [Hylemonella sp.]
MFDNFRQDRHLVHLRQTTERLIGALGESNAQSIAQELVGQYQQLDPAHRQGYFDFLAASFNPDPQLVKAAADAYAAQPDAHHLVELFKVAEPSRQELLRRINRAPGGTSAIIGMRQTLLEQLKAKPTWAAIDADMHHLLTSWFNPGFLELHEITWKSPAELLEKIIAHESVHAIDGWDDLRRRLQPDRRCFAFFHRQLPNEPLIFVEVALVPAIARDVGVLLDKKTPVGEAKTFKTAIFYSISNCQPGLRGVSLGNFLIKRVAQKLQADIPTLKVYSTLSPIPGLTRWLDEGASLEGAKLSDAQLARLAQARELLQLPGKTWRDRLKSGWQPSDCSEPEKEALMRLAAAYLIHRSTERGGDPVAHFHLTNGATLHQLNWAADLSRKGLQQYGGLMVNYLYEPDKVEAQHEAFINGKVIRSRGVDKLL